MTQADLFLKLEELARDNQWTQIEEELKNVKASALHPGDRLTLASMARRAYKIPMALRILRPLVFDLNRMINQSADKKALSEYATCLTMVGARRTAKRFLEMIPVESSENLFAWVTLHFAESSYDLAIPFLEKYILSVDDIYKKKVGELNLCACWVATEDYKSAEKKLIELKEYFLNQHHKTLLANTEELMGQIYIYQKKWDEALTCLDSAEQLNTGGNELYSLFIEKWKLVVAIAQNKVNLSEVIQFMEKALRLKNAQSCRDVLFQWATHNNDKQLLEKLYFGTPFRSYRQLILKEMPELSQTQKMAWNGEWFHHAFQNQFLVQKQPTSNLSLSKNEMKLIEALSEDFLQPKSIGSLFEAIFPNEYLHPEYSFGKTYKILQRLNKKLKQARLPIRIQNFDSSYLLELNEGWMIEVLNPDFRFTSELNMAEGRLVQTFSQKPFTRNDVMQVFHLERSTALRWLAEMKNKGIIKKIGSGPGSFYRIAS